MQRKYFPCTIFYYKSKTNDYIKLNVRKDVDVTSKLCWKIQGNVAINASKQLGKLSIFLVINSYLSIGFEKCYTQFLYVTKLIMILMQGMWKCVQN